MTCTKCGKEHLGECKAVSNVGPWVTWHVPAQPSNVLIGELKGIRLGIDQKGMQSKREHDR
jgi:hypothetical protein